SAAAFLRRFGHIEAITDSHPEVRNGFRLSQTLIEQRELALLFKRLATLRVNAPLFRSVDELRWQGPTPTFAKFAERIEAPELIPRAERAVLGVRSSVRPTPRYVEKGETKA